MTEAVSTPPAPDFSHCWCHHVDEPIPPNVYRVCFECGHVWTASALRSAWRHAFPMPTFGWRSDGFDLVGPIQWTRYFVHRYLTPARRIYFCQECIHDF